MSARDAVGSPDLSMSLPPGEKSLWASVGPAYVTFRTRRLEPRLVWAIALFTVWAGMALSPGDPVVWLLALYFAAVGSWCRLSPAHHQSLMLARAALMLVGAFALQVTAQAGGAGEAFFVWPVMVTAIYSLLLSGRWALAFWTLAVVEFVASRTLAMAPLSWQLAMAQAGTQVFFAFVSMEVGLFMKELDQQAELSHKDRSSRLYNQAGFFAHGGQLFQDCKRRKRPFAVVLLNSADLREVAELAGQKAANQLFAQLVRRIESATPAEGLAARTDSIEFGLALPGVTAARAAALLHQQLGQPARVELVLKDRTLTVMLDAVIAEATADMPSLEDMYDRLRARLPGRPGADAGQRQAGESA